MATDPQFASVVALGAGILGAVETSLTVPTTAVSIVAGGVSGTKIEEIVVHAVTTSLTPTTVAGLVYVFLHDGTTFHLVDSIPVTAVTASATTPPFRASRTYMNLWLKNNWSLRCSQSHASNASILKVTIFGGDY